MRVSRDSNCTYTKTNKFWNLSLSLFHELSFHIPHFVLREFSHVLALHSHTHPYTHSQQNTMILCLWRTMSWFQMGQKCLCCKTQHVRSRIGYLFIFRCSLSLSSLSLSLTHTYFWNTQYGMSLVEWPEKVDRCSQWNQEGPSLPSHFRSLSLSLSVLFYLCI